MEALGGVKRGIGKEMGEGSCPLAFDRIEFGSEPFQYITSEGKLDEVLAYLLRIRSFRRYAGKSTGSNVYTDFGISGREGKPRRARSAAGMEKIYRRAQRYKRRMNPDYGGRVCAETVRCYFKLPEPEGCGAACGGQETRVFIMPDRHILGLYALCEAARQSASWGGAECGHPAGQGQKIADPDGVKVLFRALLLDSVEFAGDGAAADFCSVYCLE